MALWESKGIDVQIDAERHLALSRQLDAYFERKLHRFKVLLDMRGTPFQLEVWDLLGKIPFGKTRTYGDIAKALDRPNASRAVGRAVGTNPVAIVVPCHRVIGSDGSLTGYGGGLERKEALLELETFEDS
jgi:methylated-DNA-[protein]-cysteine S-methyltransferase